ncbi:hypothetical protein EGW08_017109 [Elysia chlorotica]|uniref:DUF1518 domain-containing protein n=1 Tax=Elysia chlorotica TaxID=188477 RepID=A0A433T0Q8_ELYCH|nr:hypothetical protein EGW08_017109 [Elysia chlorotica]
MFCMSLSILSLYWILICIFQTEAVAPAIQSSGNELLDLFGGPQPGNGPNAFVPSASNDLMNGTSSDANLFEGKGATEEKKTSTKDSIMALFGGTGGGGGGVAPAQPQQMYNIPATSVTPTQNGAAGPLVASTAALMPGFGSNVYNQSMMSASQVVPTQHGMIHHGVVDQSKQFGYGVSPLTNQQQQQQQQQRSSSCVPAVFPSQSQGMVLNQQPGGQNFVNSPAETSQNSNIYGHFYQQQNNPFVMTTNYQQSQISTSVTNQTGQMQSAKSTTAASNNQNRQASFSGMTTMAGAGPSTQTKAGAAVMPDYGQNFRPMYSGQAQTSFYGGMYMPQGQQAFPGMMVPPQNMMGQTQNMMGYQPNMMGQQPQGMMANPAMNGSQMGMYNNAMMPGTQGGMYTPQQMQQMQFQQMQQQMAAMNMGGPQQMQGSWGGNPGTGQTLSNNLWQ